MILSLHSCFSLKMFKALNGRLCADVPLRNYSLTHSFALTQARCISRSPWPQRQLIATTFHETSVLPMISWQGCSNSSDDTGCNDTATVQSKPTIHPGRVQPVCTETISPSQYSQISNYIARVTTFPKIASYEGRSINKFQTAPFHQFLKQDKSEIYVLQGI